MVADGASAEERISGRRLSAAAFRDLQPPRCTGCQVTVHRAPPPDLLWGTGAGRSPAGTEAAAGGGFYFQNNTVQKG